MNKDEYTSMYELETDYWWYKALHELVEFHVKKIAGAGELRILDAGCGTGKMVEILGINWDIITKLKCDKEPSSVII